MSPVTEPDPPTRGVARIRRNILLGCVGFIALPYALAIGLMLGGQGEEVGVALLVIPLALGAIGLLELGTVVARIAALMALFAGVLAIAVLLEGDVRTTLGLATFMLAPGLTGLAMGVFFAAHQLVGTPLMLLGGGAITVLAFCLSPDDLYLPHALGLVLLGFGFTMAGPVMLTFRPLPAGGSR